LGSVTTIWTKEKLKKEAKKYKTRGEFWTNSPSAASKACEKKLLNELFKNHINQGYLCKPSGYWNEEKLQKEANKYQTRKELYDNNCSAYNIIRQNKLLDKIFKDHPNHGYLKKPKKKNI